MEFFLLLLVTTVWSQSAARECNLDYELPCSTSNECIHKQQWCDRAFNCKDGSDEYFCSVDSCPESLFLCSNRKCVPNVAVCDGHDDCGDGSDEKCKIPIEPMDKLQKLDGPNLSSTNRNASSAVASAADYLIKEQTDNGWKSFTPRVVVALAFAERAGVIPKKWLSLLRKEVNIKIKLNLMKNNATPSLCDLAHYINALYATCQNPRNLPGIDLVSFLRSEVNAAKDLDMPYVFLTLCIADEIDDNDTWRLKKMDSKITDSTLGSRALIIMALACISDKQGTHHNFKREFNRFERATRFLISSFDIYTKALYNQALNALHSKTDLDFSRYQHPDGSFGDVLATYYAIPVLLNTSLMDLKCRSSDYDGAPNANEWARPGPELNVVYSLWIEKETYLDSHSMTISLERGKTFYDAMEMAAAKNSLFRFLKDETSEGTKIYSLADYPNDAEIGKCWSLYRGQEDRVKPYSKTHLTKQKQGVDRIFPEAGEHFIFWYERS